MWFRFGTELSWIETPVSPAFGEHLLESPASVLLTVEVEQFRYAQARAEQHGDGGVIAQPLVVTTARANPERLRGRQEPQLLAARDSPFHCGSGSRGGRTPSVGQPSGNACTLKWIQRAKCRTLA